ncbi:MFS transporter [Streptosporangiaceae bacterium NEAU-GS5]|nr:MFS transporter [Streptosporangiaceae bacterium NEAU-GS5]
MKSLHKVVLVAGFVLAALNLRPALSGVSPLLGEIMADLGLTPAAGGAITTVMVLCLGVLGPLAPVLAARVGVDRTLLAGLLLLALGIWIRASGGPIPLYAGAALAGAAIAIMNVIMPGVVKRHFPDRVGLYTGIYVSGLVAGAAGASALMVPLAHDHGWRLATASAALLALLSALLWLPQARRRHVPDHNAPRPYRMLLRRRTTWYVTIFMGLQSMTFYIVLAWLPTIFRDAGLAPDQAGYLLSLTNLSQLGATFAVPVLAGRTRSQVPYVVTAAVLTMIGYVGVLAAPTTVPWLWMIVLGVGQGASLALVLLIITLRAPDPSSVTALSAIAQSIGYVVAALGPLGIGVLHQATGGWTIPLLAGLAVCFVQLAAGVRAGSPDRLREPLEQAAGRPD